MSAPGSVGSMRLRLVLLSFAALVSMATALGTTQGEAEGETRVEVATTAGAFSPDVIHLAPGGVVVWRNADGRGHTVTSAWDDGATFDAVLKPGESLVMRFDAAGEYRIRCLPHSVEDGHSGHEGMVATVKVVGPAESSQGGLDLTPLLALLGAGLLVFVLVKLRAGVPLPRPRRATRP